MNSVNLITCPNVYIDTGCSASSLFILPPHLDGLAGALQLGFELTVYKLAPFAPLPFHPSQFP